jgi:hypothetical protein
MKTKFLYCIWFAGLLCMANPMVQAQTIITSGSHVIVGTGATLTTTQNMDVNNGGNLLVNGTLTLKKDLVNQNASQDDLGPGTVQFTGVDAQNLTGQNIFQNVYTDTYGLFLAGNTRVNGVFTLIDGRVTLGSGNLLLGPSATFAGSLNYKRMIVATGSGDLRKEFPGPGSFTYPVGDADGNPEYSPVTLTFTSGNFPAGNYIGIKLQNVKYPSALITGNYLNRYWVLKQSGLGTPVYDATFQYTVADVVGNEALLSCTRVSNQTWSTYSPANPTLHELSGTGIVGVGSFTGVKSTTAPEYQELVNIGIGYGETRCYDATQILYVAGNGNTFIVDNGGSATLIAGVKISILPGVKVYAGGYLHAYISTNGIYCGTMMNPLVTNPGTVDETLSVATGSKEKFIRIYPNPTADVFTVECRGTGVSVPVYLNIYSMEGQHLSSKLITGETKQQFSLAGMPPGFYLIHARSENQSEIAKIIKY